MHIMLSMLSVKPYHRLAMRAKSYCIFCMPIIRGAALGNLSTSHPVLKATHTAIFLWPVGDWINRVP